MHASVMSFSMERKAGRQKGPHQVLRPRCNDRKCQRHDGLRLIERAITLCAHGTSWHVSTENKRLTRQASVTLGSTEWCTKCDRVYVPPAVLEIVGDYDPKQRSGDDGRNCSSGAFAAPGSVLGQGVSALDLCMVLAKIFRVQYTEVALLRLEGGLLRFVFPEYLRTTG